MLPPNEGNPLIWGIPSFGQIVDMSMFHINLRQLFGCCAGRLELYNGCHHHHHMMFWIWRKPDYCRYTKRSWTSQEHHVKSSTARSKLADLANHSHIIVATIWVVSPWHVQLSAFFMRPLISNSLHLHILLKVVLFYITHLFATAAHTMTPP